MHYVYDNSSLLPHCAAMICDACWLLLGVLCIALISWIKCFHKSRSVLSCCISCQTRSSIHSFIHLLHDLVAIEDQLFFHHSFLTLFCYFSQENKSILLHHIDWKYSPDVLHRKNKMQIDNSYTINIYEDWLNRRISVFFVFLHPPLIVPTFFSFPPKKFTLYIPDVFPFSKKKKKPLYFDKNVLNCIICASVTNYSLSLSLEGGFFFKKKKQQHSQFHSLLMFRDFLDEYLMMYAMELDPKKIWLGVIYVRVRVDYFTSIKLRKGWTLLEGGKGVKRRALDGAWYSDVGYEVKITDRVGRGREDGKV